VRHSVMLGGLEDVVDGLMLEKTKAGVGVG
jgi:hypothetical protein